MILGKQCATVALFVEQYYITLPYRRTYTVSYTVITYSSQAKQ